jgi:selenocysteine lyase/cysteine desulfurase
MNITEIRSLFPHLKTDQLYFNHAAIGPWSSLILNRITEYSEQRSCSKIENYPSLIRWNISAKEKLGKLLGASPDRIAWTDNVSNGTNILAQGLEWKTGDRILLNDIEFPSNVYPFMNLKKHGVEIDFAKSRNGIVDVEELETLITPKTKLISISLVQFLSGYRADIYAIGELCKQHGIIFCVDAIQGTGVVKIDVKKSNIDFLTGGSQKWLMSSQGLSYIFITEELQSRIDQKFVGWTSVKDAWNLLDFELIFRDSADRFQNGTVNAFGVAIFEASLSMFTQFGIENIESRVLENSDFFIRKLVDIGLEPVLKNAGMNNIAGIVSFMHDKSLEIFDLLEKRRIYTAVREGMIRFSPHFYNTIEEIQKAVDQLEIILGEIK